MAIDGKWNVTINSPMGAQSGELSLKQDGDALSGEMNGAMGTVVLENGKVSGDDLTWQANVTAPMPLTLDFSVKIEDGNLNGIVKLGAFGEAPITGVPV